MRLAQVDQLAVAKSGMLHTLSAPAKLLGSLIILLGLMAVGDIWQLAALAVLTAGLLAVSGLPAWLLRLALYPTIFSLPFAAAALTRSVAAAVVIPGKAAAAALLLLLVIASTPYPQLIKALAGFLPRMLVDVIFLTYRMFFILVDSIDQLLVSMRLRGAFSWRNAIWSIKVTFHALGLLFVNGINAGERFYQNLCLRGYDDQVIHPAEQSAITPHEWGYLALLVTFVSGVLLLG